MHRGGARERVLIVADDKDAVDLYERILRERFELMVARARSSVR